jgi:hypothetical protein
VGAALSAAIVEEVVGSSPTKAVEASMVTEEVFAVDEVVPLHKYTCKLSLTNR